MIERSNDLVYVKRDYFFPFKPFLDYEYKRFGYKKCDTERGNKKFVNTAYYVRHSECPKGLYDTLYLLNLPLSYFRTLVAPVLLAIWLLSMLIEGTTGIYLLIDRQAIFLMLIFPVMLVSTFLSNMAYNAYRKNDTDGKLDRALKSRGWTPWTSYKDNDPRFTPPTATVSASASKASPAAKPSVSKSSTPPPANNVNLNLGNEDGIITLQSANGEFIDFTAIAVIIYKGRQYAIMQPTELIEGMDDDEALVFKVTVGQDGASSFEIELNDQVIDAVFDEYNRLYDQANGR